MNLKLSKKQKNNESYWSFNYWDQRILSNYPGFLHFPNIYHLHLFTIILKEWKRIISRIHSSDNSEHPYLFIMFVKKRKKDSRSHPQWFRSLWITELIIQECDFDGISQICTFDISHLSFGNLYIYNRFNHFYKTHDEKFYRIIVPPLVHIFKA